MAGRKIRLSVRAKNGRLETFQNVSPWTFSQFYNEVRKRFGIQGAITLMIGESELPNNDEKIGTSDIGLVSGDRLRLVAAELSDKAEVDSTTTAASSTSTPAAQTSASTSVPSKSTSVTGEEMDTSPPLNTGDFVGNILAKMRAEGFECFEQSDGNNRMKFKHPSSTLVVEIALQLYEDARSKCAHVTASIIYPTRRVFLNPVVLRDESSDSLKELVEEVIKSSLGSRNPFLRLLHIRTVASRILSNLKHNELLRLEMTCKDTLQVCRGELMEELWRRLLSKDFDRTASTNETSREAYKRCYVERRDRLRAYEYESTFGYQPLPVQRPHFNPIPYPYPYPNQNPDPDLPQGPFQPSRNPYMPPPNPFPQIPPRGPTNPFDPLQREIFPSRPRRPDGMPRYLPPGNFGGGGGFI